MAFHQCYNKAMLNEINLFEDVRFGQQWTYMYSGKPHKIVMDLKNSYCLVMS